MKYLYLLAFGSLVTMQNTTDSSPVLLSEKLYTVTTYRSVRAQTDSTPFTTSIQTWVMEGGIAVSQDQLCPGSLMKDIRIKRHSAMFCSLSPYKLHYGDVVYIRGFGLYRINDCMNARHKDRFDIWVKTYKEEKAFGTRRLYVYRITGA